MRKAGERVMCQGRIAQVARTQHPQSNLVLIAFPGNSPVWKRASGLSEVVERGIETEVVLHPYLLPGDATEPL